MPDEEKKTDVAPKGNEESENKEESGSKDELLQLKKNFAKEYFEKIYSGNSNSSLNVPNLNLPESVSSVIGDQGGLSKTLLLESGTVQDYMTSEGIVDKIKDKFLLHMILERILEKETMDKLDSMKKQIDAVATEEDLEKLKSGVAVDNQDNATADNNVVQESSDPAVIQEQDKMEQTIKDVSLDVKEYGSKRERILAILEKIIQYDHANPVKYNWGKRASLEEGLDCSGLIIYALHQIGLKEMGANSRDMFPKLETQKITQESGGNISSDVNINKGDLLFRDSKNSDQKLNGSAIPEIEKDGQEYRIHHVAFVKDVDKSTGEITIVESNGKNGVVERKITPEEEKQKKHQSDLYVGSVDYDKLIAYKGPKENVLDQVA